MPNCKCLERQALHLHAFSEAINFFKSLSKVIGTKTNKPILSLWGLRNLVFFLIASACYVLAGKWSCEHGLPLVLPRYHSYLGESVPSVLNTQWTKSIVLRSKDGMLVFSNSCRETTADRIFREGLVVVNGNWD